MAAACLLALLACQTGQAAQGSDIATGYDWFDSNDGAIGVAGTFDAPVVNVSPANNSAPTLATLPFSFPFYGGTFTSMWISDNGWISFTDPGVNSYPTPAALPSVPLPNRIIAPLWTDLNVSNTLMGHRIRHAPSNGIGAYRIQWSGTIISSGETVIFDVYLFPDGRIKFQYPLSANTSTATVGIENGGGTDGFSIVRQGVPAPGVPSTFPAVHVIDILPPPLLASACGSVPDLACGSLTDSLPGGFANNILTYGCGATNQQARERVYRLTLTEMQRVNATLTLGSATNLSMYLLSACSERRCLRQGGGLNVLLAAGVYYLVVDAPLVANEGTYTLDVTCTPMGQRITCGDTVSGDTTGGTNTFTNYGCAPGTELSGPEAWYLVTLPAGANLRASLSGLGADLDVVVLDVSQPGLVSVANCVGHSDDSVVLWNVAAGEYAIGVEGVVFDAGTFTLETECGPVADCSVIAGTVDFTGGDIVAITGDTRGAVNTASAYNCLPGALLDGGELVYEVVVPRDTQLGIYEPGAQSELSYILLTACNEGTCVASNSGGCQGLIAAGIYYLVVDSPAGLEGPFEAEILLSDPFGHWTNCQLPQGGTSPTDTVNTVWSFSDEAYCYSDPLSHNYPDGCTFAMYVAPQCGTEFHIPLRDVESGRVAVYDMLRGEYMTLTATSSTGWSQTGTLIEWEDCAGTNPNFNDVVVDVWFQRATGLCGIYRIEFPLFAGFVWDLYANCSGMGEGEFPIYDSFCGAAAAYNPLPSVNLIDPTVVLNCPDIEVTYSIVNTGCADATDVEVTLFDFGVPVYTDIVPLVEPNGRVTRVFTTTFPGGTSSSSVELRVDPDNLMQECEETIGAGCRIVFGVDSARLDHCSADCEVMPSATATPDTICEGGTVTIDASASTFRACPTGQLEYQIRGPGIGMPWQSSPVFAGFSPTVSGDYAVDARCSDPALSATCVATAIVRIDVDVAPAIDPASVVAQLDCDPGIQINWATATFFGPTGRGVYNVYRSTVSCADAVDPASPTGELLGGTFATSYLDATALPGVDYYYVVEAEDETGFVGGCTPTGPTYGGAVTRVDVSGGTCTAVQDAAGGGTDPEFLPRVGPSLRLGAPLPYSESEVTLRWSTDVPIDVAGGEHFHILRSTQPNTGFAQVNAEPPLLQVGQWTDSAAAPGTPLLFYLVFVSNACHEDNRDYDR